MTEAEGSYRVLDDLPNLATKEAYAELADKIFVSEASGLSKVEVWGLSSYLPTAQQEKRPGEDDWGVDNFHPKTPSIAYGSNDHQVKLRQEVITSTEEVEAYMTESRKLCAFFIRKRNSYSPLYITRTLFERLCEYAGVQPRFHDYIVYLGRRTHEIEIAPPPLALDNGPGGTRKKEHNLQIMCIVRFVESNMREEITDRSSVWSIRQTAVFCGVGQDNSQVVSLFVSISPAIEEILKSTWTHVEHASSSPFWTLLALYHFAVCNWRPYMVALASDVDKHETNLFATTTDTARTDLNVFEMRYDLLNLEKKVLTAKLAIQSTKADLDFLRGEIRARSSEHTEVDAKDRKFQQRFAESVRDLNVNLMRVEELRCRLQSIASSLSSYLEWSGNQNLQQLTLESKTESENMRKLNEKMKDLAEKNAEEAVTITVLALLTLIYLPLTVVSNFFSTSFVGLGSSSNRIFVTKDWWILFVVAIPLTGLTIYVWWVWARIKAKRRYPFWWSLLGLKKEKPTDERGELWEPSYELTLRSHVS